MVQLLTGSKIVVEHFFEILNLTFEVTESPVGGVVLSSRGIGPVNQRLRRFIVSFSDVFCRRWSFCRRCCIVGTVDDNLKN